MKKSYECDEAFNDPNGVKSKVILQVKAQDM